MAGRCLRALNVAGGGFGGAGWRVACGAKSRPTAALTNAGQQLVGRRFYADAALVGGRGRHACRRNAAARGR